MNDEPSTDIRAALAAPFEPGEIKWKAQTVRDTRALAVPYVDARVVMDRLDDVFGVGGWQTSYREAKDGIVCTLRVLVAGEWRTHEDIGGESEQPDEGDRQKAAFSDALKRAAVHLGVGRYLYRAPKQWVDYDPQKKQFRTQPTLPGSAPAKTQQQKPAQPAKQEKAPPSKLSLMQEFDARLHRHFGQDLGYKLGDLITHLKAALVPNHGVPEAWGEADWHAAHEQAEVFVAGLRQRMATHLTQMLERKGYAGGDLWDLAEKVGAPGTPIADLSNEQMARGMDLLRPLPDKAAKKRA